MTNKTINKYVVYETATGFVQSAHDVPGPTHVFVPPGFSLLQVDDDADIYVISRNKAVKNGVLVDIPPNPSPLYYRWDGEAWTDPRPPDVKLASQWDLVRSQRDILLQNSDFVMLSDVPFTDTQRAQWQQYRQALRDITTQPDPFNIVWPTKPGT